MGEQCPDLEYNGIRYHGIMAQGSVIGAWVEKGQKRQRQVGAIRSGLDAIDAAEQQRGRHIVGR